MTRGLLSLIASKPRTLHSRVIHVTESPTLSSHENERHLRDISVMTHLREVLIDRFETLFVLETEDEDDRVDPMSQLKNERKSDVVKKSKERRVT